MMSVRAIGSGSGLGQGLAHPTQCEALTPALHLVRIRLVGLKLGTDRVFFRATVQARF